MKRFYTLFILTLICVCTFGQTREITGKVTSAQNKEPIIAATVAAMLKGDAGNYIPTSYGAFTDIDGSFVLEIPNDAAAIEVSCICMKTKLVPVTS